MHRVADGNVALGIHRSKDYGGGCGNGWNEALRECAHPDHQDNQRNTDCILAEIKISQPTHLSGSFPEENALIKPQHVTSRQDNADGGEDSPAEIDQRGSLQNQKLPDEVVEHREADAGEHGDHEHGSELRRGRGHTAVSINFERMPPFIEETDHDEKGAGGDAVVQHLVNRAIESLLGETEDSKHHESKMAD